MAAAQPAGIEGVVLNHATGQPLAGVHVRFVTGDFSGGGMEQAYGAISDRAGHFSVAGLQAGIYVVMPERNGFVQVTSAHPNMPIDLLPVKAGQKIADYKIEMTPCAILSGRVLDEYGDPVQNISVQLEPVSPNAQGFFIGRNNNTDERGEFRMVTAPGRYRLHASQFPFGMMGGPEIRTDGTSSAPYESTYYPSTASSGSAAIVEAGPGQDVTGLEIRMVRGAAAAGAALTISGVVSGIPEGAHAAVMMRYGESAEKLNSSNQTVAPRDGKFTFRGLQPGFYRIFAQYSAGKTFLASQAVDVTLTSADETLQLLLAPGGELTGTLEIAGDPKGTAGGLKHTVRLDPLDANFGDTDSANGEVDAKGAFRIGRLAPGRFRAVVEPLPENGYIQSVTLNGAPVTDSILDLTRGAKGSDLKITVVRNGAQISGAVLNSEGEPLASPLVMVFLATDVKQLHEQDGDEQNRATGGKYMLKAIRPGKYHLWAVDALAMFASAGDADHDEDAAMKALFDAAEEIEVKPGDRIVKDLKAIDKVPGKEPPHAAPK